MRIHCSSFDFKGKKVLYSLVLISFMVPFEAIAIPLYSVEAVDTTAAGDSITAALILGTGLDDFADEIQKQRWITRKYRKRLTGFQRHLWNQSKPRCFTETVFEVEGIYREEGAGLNWENINVYLQS